VCLMESLSVASSIYLLERKQCTYSFLKCSRTTSTSGYWRWRLCCLWLAACWWWPARRFWLFWCAGFM